MVPKQFNLIDKTIKVETSMVAGAIGFADYFHDKIIIDESITEDEGKEEIFYHELVHWILFIMRNKLESDEDFVSLFGSLLRQAMKSARAKEESDG